MTMFKTYIWNFFASQQCRFKPRPFMCNKVYPNTILLMLSKLNIPVLKYSANLNLSSKWCLDDSMRPMWRLDGERVRKKSGNGRETDRQTDNNWNIPSSCTLFIKWLTQWGSSIEKKVPFNWWFFSIQFSISISTNKKYKVCNMRSCGNIEWKSLNNPFI